jgi:hypothetical protein
MLTGHTIVDPTYQTPGEEVWCLQHLHDPI